MTDDGRRRTEDERKRVRRKKKKFRSLEVKRVRRNPAKNSHNPF
jgi:hypothetical protein